MKPAHPLTVRGGFHDERSASMKVDPHLSVQLPQGRPFLSPFFWPCPPLLLGGGFGVTTTTGGFSLGGGGGLSLCASAKTLTDTMQSIMVINNIRFKYFMITCFLLMSISHERAWEGEETRQPDRGAISVPQTNTRFRPAFTSHNLPIIAGKRTLSDASRTVSCIGFDAPSGHPRCLNGAQ